VTLDLKMPGLSGIDVLRQIKRNDPDIEVVVITAYGTVENAQEANRYGAGFITKPFNVSDLINSIIESLERRSTRLRLKNFAQYNLLVVRS
jgi:DNA-binding NtrC family response regulator